MAVVGVAHVAISTPDLDRAVRFWTTVGFAEVRRWSWDRVEVVDRLTGLVGSSATAALLEGFGFALELFEFSSPAQTRADATGRPVSDHGLTHVCLTVDALDPEVERLRDAGMTFWADPVTDPRGARMTYGRDPDGNVVELVQRAADAGPVNP